ncbi:MAG TPA: ABC transporter ATP-binding protein [Syntrophobacteraceae bacterium]|nr:ABC transporter ATP-binding protein [Syntrophobacteraceae bacterium]
MLRTEALHVYYGGIHALKGIDIKIDRGQIVSLIGANGAGKTTAFKVIVGLLRPRSGAVYFLDKEITRLNTHNIIQQGIAVSPEGRRIFGNLTVMDNLELGAYNRTFAEFAKAVQWVFSIFPRLSERQAQLAGKLSGGEQQMLAFARALMSRPKLVLLDEPSLGLAPLMVEEVFKAIRQINDEGTTILLIEQNAVAALSIAHYGYVLETGEVVLEGPGRELLRDERVRKAYLGET